MAKQRRINPDANVQRIHASEWKVGSQWGMPHIDLYNDDGQIVHRIDLHDGHRRDAEWVVRLAKNKLGSADDSPWASAQKYTRKFGCNPKKVALIAKGVFYERVFKPFPNWTAIVRRGKHNLRRSDWNALEHVDLIDQAVNDGIKNITPIIALYGLAPKDLKGLVGNATWKKVCKNSFTKNRLIYHYLSRGVRPFQADEDSAKELSECIDIPSTFLKTKDLYDSEFMHTLIAKNHLGLPWSKLRGQEFIGAYQTSQDTKRMLDDEGEVTFNPNWSFRRIQEEHDRLSRLQQEIDTRRANEADQAYKELIKTDISKLHKGIVYGGVVNCVYYNALTTHSSIIDEGKEMRHCAGSYVSTCCKGNYLLYSLTKAGRRSTLGINVTRKTVIKNGKEVEERQYKFNQHYHACNESIKDVDFELCAKHIIEELNKANKEWN